MSDNLLMVFFGWEGVGLAPMHLLVSGIMTARKIMLEEKGKGLEFLYGPLLLMLA